MADEDYVAGGDAKTQHRGEGLDHPRAGDGCWTERFHPIAVPELRSTREAAYGVVEIRCELAGGRWVRLVAMVLIRDNTVFTLARSSVSGRARQSM